MALSLGLRRNGPFCAFHFGHRNSWKWVRRRALRTSDAIHLAEKRAFRGSSQAFSIKRKGGRGPLYMRIYALYMRLADDVLGWGRESGRDSVGF